MKKFIILFRTGSFPFSSTKRDIYVKEWNGYINKLATSKKLQDYTFLKKESVFISDKETKPKSYIPHKDILSGFIIISANTIKEVEEICKDCPVFNRNGDLEIKEIDQDYLGHK